MSRFRIGITAVVLTLLLGACGQNQEANTPLPATGDPVSGGTFTVAVDSDPGTLNAVIRTTSLAGNIIGIVNDALVAMNEQMEFEPALGRSWTWSDDGLSLTYHLRTDVLWSDGHAFVADDVVATYELFTNPIVATPRRSNFEKIESVTAVDDSTVVIRYSQRNMEMIFNSAFSLLPAHVIRELDPAEIESWEINRSPICNGPYQVTNWISNERVVLERNPKYWGEPGYFDQIVFKVVPEEATRLLQLEIGEADMVENVPHKDIERLKQVESIALRQLGPRNLGYLVYNLENSILADSRVRNAISLAIDRRAFVDGLLFGFGRPLANPMTPMLAWAYNDRLEPHARDLEESMRLLESAGWVDSDGDGIRDRDGKPLRFTVKTRTGDPVRENGVLVLQRNLRDVGIDMRTRMLELSTVLSQVDSGDFDVYMGQVGARLSPDLSSSFATDGGFNYGHYSNPLVDNLIGAARLELDRDIAADLWRQVQEILYREQPMSMLYARDPLVGLRREIQNANPNFLSPYEDIHRWWKLPTR